MNATRLEFLLQRYFDAQLAPHEKEELEESLLRDPRARRAFWQAARTHGLLRLWGEEEWGRRAAAERSSPVAPELPWWRSWLAVRVRRPLIWAAGAALTAAIALVLFRSGSDETPPSYGVSRNTPGDVAERSVFTRASGVAVLKSAVDVVWEQGARAYQPGDTLLPGWLRLRSGAVQIEFARGARVMLEGPAEFNLISPEAAQVKAGRLRVHVAEPASGFRITSEFFELVDRGTEFGCDVPLHGAPEVYVFQGWVEVSSPKRGWVKQSIKANEAATVTVDGLRPIAPNRGVFLNDAELAKREQTDFRERLANWQRQSRLLSEHTNLVLHYTFEHGQPWERTLVNRARGAAPGTDGTLVGCNWTQGRWPGKGAVEFSRNDDRIRTHVPGKFKSLTYLAWLRVDSLPNHYTSLAMTESLEVGEVHWSLDQFGNLLLSARKVPPTNPADWAYAMAKAAVRPEMAGSWVMLASVFDAEESTITHYINGEPTPSSKIAFPDPLVLGDLEIGNWGVRTDDPRWARLAKAGSSARDRSLKGRLDEFLLLAAPLSAAEIQTIYDYGKPAASAAPVASLHPPPQPKQPTDKPS